MTETSTAQPDPALLDAVETAIDKQGAEDSVALNLSARASLRATGEWLAERLAEEAERNRADIEGWVRQEAYVEADRAAVRAAALWVAHVLVGRLCGVPAPGAPAKGETA